MGSNENQTNPKYQSSFPLYCIFSIASMVVVPLVIEKCTGYYLIRMRSTMSNNPHTCMKLEHWTKHVTSDNQQSIWPSLWKCRMCSHFLSHIFLWWWMDLQNWTKLCACARARIAETTENGCTAVMKNEMHEK